MHFNFTGILGWVVYFSQLTSGVSFAVDGQVFLETSGEVQEYARNVAEDIYKTSTAILMVSPDQREFESILASWNQLLVRLSHNFNVLKELGKLDSSLGITASNVFDDLQLYWLEVIQNPDICKILFNYSLNADHNFVTDLTTLNFEAGSFLRSQMFDFFDKVLSENADVVCIQEIIDDNVCDLYEVLNKNYRYFIYIPFKNEVGFLGECCNRGVLIASKYKMKRIQFNSKDVLVASGFKVLRIKSRSDRNDDKGGGSCEAGVTARWGEDKNVQWEGYVKGEAHDGKGNYAEGRITQKDNGKGEADIHGGHESKKK